jgi:hypothetical protein
VGVGGYDQHPLASEAIPLAPINGGEVVQPVIEGSASPLPTTEPSAPGESIPLQQPSTVQPTSAIAPAAPAIPSEPIPLQQPGAMLPTTPAVPDVRGALTAGQIVR